MVVAGGSRAQLLMQTCTQLQIHVLEWCLVGVDRLV